MLPAAATIPVQAPDPGTADDSPALLAAASASMASGDPRRSAVILRRLVALTPADADRTAFLAVAMDAARSDAPMPWLRRTTTIEPDEPIFATNLILALRRAGNGPLAVRYARRALARSPAFPSLWLHLGEIVLPEDPKGALAPLRRALALELGDSAALLSLAECHGQLDDATARRRVLKLLAVLSPKTAPGHFALATGDRDGRPVEGAEIAVRRGLSVDAMDARGWQLAAELASRSGRPERTRQLTQTVLALQPDDVNGHTMLGTLAFEAGRSGVDRFARAAAIAPKSSEALSNLANALYREDRSGEALRRSRQALAFEPALPGALNNFGAALHSLLDLPGARAWLTRAMCLPGIAKEAQWNRALANLLEGRLQEGWRDFEARWSVATSDVSSRRYEAPRWQGEALAGRTLLLHAEQGFGDTIQFVRFIPAIVARGGDVILEIQPALVPLLRNFPGVSRIVARGSPLPRFDFHTSLMSLPWLLGTFEDPASGAPYLSLPPRPLPEAVGQAMSGRRIGLVWSGNPQHRDNRKRSLPVDDLVRFAEGLLTRADVSLFSLHIGPRSEELRDRIRSGRIIDLPPGFQDFAGTAAIISALDLVITVDTVAGHLSGALGRPTWILLHHVPDWRWRLDRDDTSWYRSARLFRQSLAGDWASVVDRVLAALP